MVAYPNDLPVTEGLELVSIIRNNEIVAKKAKFAYNVWLLQGFVQKSIIGDPNSLTDISGGGGVVLTPSAVPANFDPMTALEKACVAAQNGTPQAQFSVPWKEILMWALTELSSILTKE